MTTSTADSVQVVSPGRTHVGKQGFTYGSGASAETVGAQQICMHVLPMPDGTRAKVHYHKGIETIAYLLSGECIVFYGDALEHHVTAHAGDHVFVRRTLHMDRRARLWQRSGWHCSAAKARPTP